MYEYECIRLEKDQITYSCQIMQIADKGEFCHPTLVLDCRLQYIKEITAGLSEANLREEHDQATV